MKHDLSQVAQEPEFITQLSKDTVIIVRWFAMGCAKRMLVRRLHAHHTKTADIIGGLSPNLG